MKDLTDPTAKEIEEFVINMKNGYYASFNDDFQTAKQAIRALLEKKTLQAKNEVYKEFSDWLQVQVDGNSLDYAMQFTSRKQSNE